jgi:hypothetical protein
MTKMIGIETMFKNAWNVGKSKCLKIATWWQLSVKPIFRLMSKY